MNVVYVCVLVVYFNLFIASTRGRRRVQGGKETEGDRRFMVYLVRSAFSNQQYEGWVCGGSLITDQHILTSASCVTDVDYLYAIAGYRRYVPTELLDKDECTRKRKKRVIKTCMPQDFIMGVHDGYPAWINYNDIAIATVESPYNFNDASYYIDCSYTPKSILVNMRYSAQKFHTDAVILGWGHTRSLRMPFHVTDHNAEFLREAPTLIKVTSYCESHFNRSKFKFDDILLQTLICTIGKGFVDANGNVEEYPDLKPLDCEANPMLLRNIDEEQDKEIDTTPKPKTTQKPFQMTQFDQWSEPDQRATDKEAQTIPQNYYYDYASQSPDEFSNEKENHATTYANKVVQEKSTDFDVNATMNVNDYDRDLRRRSQISPLTTHKQGSKTTKKTTMAMDIAKERRCRRMQYELSNTRRQNLCQNDHGSPLLGWLGSAEIVLGVAITSLYNKSYDCVPPNLFVNTMYHPWLIRCGVTKGALRSSNDNEPEPGIPTQMICAIKPENLAYDMLQVTTNWPDTDNK